MKNASIYEKSFMLIIFMATCLIFETIKFFSAALKRESVLCRDICN